MPSVPLGTAFLGPNGETFETADFLGQGAFGEVYRAVGDASGSVVAVKVLPLGILASNESRQALLNEVRAAEGVRHPNIVEVLFVNDGSSSPIGPYVVMEFVSGGTLAKILRAKLPGTEMPLQRAVKMMIDIAQGARAINEKIVHRDIKPDNILIEGATLKIGDFGISKFLDESTRLHTFKGGQHIAYMAPEGWEQRAQTFKLDVYSVGLVFYQILTGRHPLLDKVKDPNSFLDWEKVHLYEPCPDVRVMRLATPVSIAQLLSRMVSKSAATRPTWDEILRVLSMPDATGDSPHPSIAAAVEAAVAHHQFLEKERLVSVQRQNERDKLLGLYRYSCTTLIDELKPLVHQFNHSFQHGKISYSDGPFYQFNVPMGRNINVSFFPPCSAGIRIRNGEVIGGGWIGIASGRSANLVLLRGDRDDLYGQWRVCEIGISAFVDQSKIIGKFGLTEGLTLPFGFSHADFYDQIRYATGTMHVFTYNFYTGSVADFFAFLLQQAVQTT